MKFALYFSGHCNSPTRGNHYSLKLNDMKDDKWTHARYTKDDYKNYHRDTESSMYGESKYWFGNEKLAIRFMEGQFYTESSLSPNSPTCTPILKISLLKNLDDYSDQDFEGLDKFCSCTKRCQTKKDQTENGLPTEKTPTMSKSQIEKSFLIIILSVAGGIVFFIIVGLALINLKNRRKFRGP